MVYKGRALYESLILSEFFEDAFPSTPKLLPTDPIEKAYARIWIDYLNKTFLPASMRLTQAQEEDKQSQALEEMLASLRTFSEQIKGPFFLGEEFSLVDVALAPWITRDYIHQEHRGYKRKDVGPKWEAYANLVEKRPSVIQTSSVSRKFSRYHIDVIPNLSLTLLPF